MLDRLAHVRVAGLFGIFDHDIPLHLDSRITVIHGPNGVGKTVVLRMIREVLATAPDVLLRVPYDEFELKFESGDTITVRPVRTSESLRSTLNYEARLGPTVHVGEFAGELDPTLIRRISGVIDPWNYMQGGQWRDPRDGEVINTAELLDRFPSLAGLKEELKIQRDSILEQVAGKCRLRLIGTDRLLTDIPEGRHREARFRGDWMSSSSDLKERTIAVYSGDLIRRFRAALSEYGKLTETLDRSLVRRLIGGNQLEKPAEELLARFKELDEKRRSLTNLGLLSVADDVLGANATDEEVIDLVSKSTDVFTLYVDDMHKKLALFDQLQNKLQIFRDRADRRLQFKTLVIDPEKGFVFKSDAGATVGPGDLSSGEQHEMILLYELLFMARNGDLVLIDEPEISLHLEWQMEFLDDLRTILSSSSIDVLVATHSAAIAGGASDEMVSLGPRRV